MEGSRGVGSCFFGATVICYSNDSGTFLSEPIKTLKAAPIAVPSSLRQVADKPRISSAAFTVRLGAPVGRPRCARA